LKFEVGLRIQIWNLPQIPEPSFQYTALSRSFLEFGGTLSLSKGILEFGI
jgi:hypothetical protein